MIESWLKWVTLMKMGETGQQWMKISAELHASLMPFLSWIWGENIKKHSHGRT